MTKNKKSLLVIALIAILSVSMFMLTGCGSDETTTGGEEQSNVIQVPVAFINMYPDTTIKELYISGAGLDNWGSELLSGEEMPTGTQLTVVLNIDKNNIEWDIKAIDEEGTEVEFRNLNLGELSTDGGTITLTAEEDGTPIAIAK